MQFSDPSKLPSWLRVLKSQRRLPLKATTMKTLCPVAVLGDDGQKISPTFSSFVAPKQSINNHIRMGESGGGRQGHTEMPLEVDEFLFNDLPRSRFHGDSLSLLCWHCSNIQLWGSVESWVDCGVQEELSGLPSPWQCPPIKPAWGGGTALGSFTTAFTFAAQWKGCCLWLSVTVSPHEGHFCVFYKLSIISRWPWSFCLQAWWSRSGAEDFNVAVSL